jgi:hypothetical protein
MLASRPRGPEPLKAGAPGAKLVTSAGHAQDGERLDDVGFVALGTCDELGYRLCNAEGMPFVAHLDTVTPVVVKRDETAASQTPGGERKVDVDVGPLMHRVHEHHVKGFTLEERQHCSRRGDVNDYAVANAVCFEILEERSKCVGSLCGTTSVRVDRVDHGRDRRERDRGPSVVRSDLQDVPTSRELCQPLALGAADGAEDPFGEDPAGLGRTFTSEKPHSGRL